MRLVALSAAVFASALTLATYSPSSAHAAEKPNTNTKESKKVVTVEPGDSLSKIATAQKTTYTRLFDANTKIEHPDLIYPGDKLRVPAKDEELKKRSLPSDVTPAQATSAPAASTPAASSYSAPSPSYRQPTYKPQTAEKSVAAPSGGVWDRLAACESGGNWATNTGNGYYGGLQFSLSSWQAVGGSGYPHQASKAEQISRAQKLQAMQGWGAWPACTAKLGIR